MAAASPSRASASRSRWSPPTRRARSRSRQLATAPTATRWPVCSTSRATRSSASTTTTTPARRSTGSGRRSRPSGAGEEPPEDGYQGAYIHDLAALRGDPVLLMLKEIETTLERFRIHFDSFRLQSELEQRLPELAAQARHVREGRCALGALLGLRRRRGPGAASLGGPHRRPTARRTWPISWTSSNAASTARSTFSAPTTTGRATGTRRSRRCSATTPSASRSSSTSSST